MLEFVQNQISFYLALILVLFLPGYFLLLAIFGKSRIVSSLERFVMAFGLSIVIVDFIYFAYSGLGIPLTRLSTFLGILAAVFVFYLIYRFHSARRPQKDAEGSAETSKLFSFSKNQFILILLLLFLAFFIKTIFLAQTISPSSTDLGHHMYWVKWLVENRALPTYDGMPDFIIGEHTIFGSMTLLGNLDFFSAFPVVVLHLFNLLGILAVFVLTLRIFRNKNIAILSLLFLGALFAITAPQSKFVSGGVVGNIMGNFLLPLAFYFYFRALAFLAAEKSGAKPENKKFLALAIFMTFGLFYTHHLTSFVFLFILAFLIIIFIAFNFKAAKNILAPAFRLFFSPGVLAVFLLGLIFFFGVFTPNYAQKSAVDTAIGAPSKASRQGLSASELNSSIGGVRLALGLVGLAGLFFLGKRRNLGYFIVAAWGIMIFLLSAVPQYFFIDLPSNRVGSYLSYPLAILSAAGLYFVFSAKENRSWKNNALVKIGFLAILGFALVEGISDSAASIPGRSNYSELVQTFGASGYLSEKTDRADKILKDHNYIAGDSWIKLFFMRGYKYPESRGYFKRYEDVTKPREMCTLHMISNPNGGEAQGCFAETGTNFIMVNPQFDSAQFRKLKNFDQIYSNSNIAIYYRK